jgi:hypothetical protein
MHGRIKKTYSNVHRIVLCTETNEDLIGVAIYTDADNHSNNIGTYSKSWISSMFYPFHGALTLIED